MHSIFDVLEHVWVKFLEIKPQIEDSSCYLNSKNWISIGKLSTQLKKKTSDFFNLFLLPLLFLRKERNKRVSSWISISTMQCLARNHSVEFISWFQDKVKSENVEDHIFWLAKNPNPTVRRYTGYFANGYRFYTRTCDSRLKTGLVFVLFGHLCLLLCNLSPGVPMYFERMVCGVVLFMVSLF